jgi:hypothetical protein
LHALELQVKAYNEWKAAQAGAAPAVDVKPAQPASNFWLYAGVGAAVAAVAGFALLHSRK